MRRVLTFDCRGDALHATLDEAAGASGLLIVSGGNETRIGAHRGMATLAAEIADAGHPVFRFDRRGVGDSAGENGGFTTSKPDIEAAIAAFRAACPQLKTIVAFGNCDAASALAIHDLDGVAALVLANPWVVESQDDLPPPAAIKSHYVARLKDPKAWKSLLTGAVDFRKLLGGLARLTAPQQKSSLSQSVADGLSAFKGTTSLIVATRDGTGATFFAEWKKPHFAGARGRADIALCEIESASHSFASADDHVALKDTILKALS